MIITTAMLADRYGITKRAIVKRAIAHGIRPTRVGNVNVWTPAQARKLAKAARPQGRQPTAKTKVQSRRRSAGEE